MKQLPNQRNKDRRNSLIAGLVLAGLCLAPGARAASNLLDFQFNEGPASLVVTSKVNNLVGTLGIARNTANDPVLTTDSPAQTAGDKAVQLNGTGFLYADDSASPILAVQTNAFTIEAWVKVDPSDAREFRGILSYGNTYKLGLDWGELVFTAFGVADIRGGVLVNPGEWHHVAAAWQPGVGVTFYIDGAATEVAFTGAFLPATGTLLSLGAERMDNAFMGSLDRVRVHKAFLTAAELDSTAASSKAPLVSTVVTYNFNDAGLPCQTTTSPARPASSSDEYFSIRSQPAFTTDCPSGKAGDYALSFTTATHVAVPDTAGVIALDSANPSFTAECWVKFGTLPQERSVLFGNNGPGAAFSMSVTSARKLFVTTFGILDIPSNATIPDDGGWHHAAVVHENGKEMRFYVDGVLGDTVPYAGGVLIGVRTDTTFIIGAEPGLWNHYAGLLDRVRLTSGILTPDQLDYLAVPGVNPGAPTLDLGSMIQISWPTVPAGYKLQSTTNINDSASWTFVTNAPYAGNGKFLVYLPSTGPKLFFRLVKP